MLGFCLRQRPYISGIPCSTSFTGSYNYLPHIPQNKFIFLDLFSKDPINNKENSQ
jgi:hypothetical protein